MASQMETGNGLTSMVQLNSFIFFLFLLERMRFEKNICSIFISNFVSKSIFCFIYSKHSGEYKMAKVISGLGIAKEIRQEIKEHILEWVDEGHRAPHLTAVLIGDDPASHTYVNNKIKVQFPDCPSVVTTQ